MKAPLSTLGRFSAGIEAGIALVSPGWAASRSLARVRAAAYAAADPRNPFLPRPWNPTRGTADQVLVPSLATLIARSRDALRRHPGAVAMVEGRIANVVGRGIGIEPDSGDDALDTLLADGFEAWAESATTDGRSLWEAQALAYREWIAAGGFLWRWVVLPERAEAGQLPDAIMELDVEWLSDLPLRPVPDAHRFVAGVETDLYGRPLFFHLVNPDTLAAIPPGARAASTRGEVVSAAEIVHGFRRIRPGQTRGEPEMAPTLMQLWNGIELIDAELKAAVVGAAPTVLVKTRSGGQEVAAAASNTGGDTGQVRADGQTLPALTMSLPAGGVAGLFPDEDVTVVENKRPSQQVHPFLKGIHGLAAGCMRIGRRWIDRDVADANYSSMRADQQDTQRLLEPEQDVFGRFAAVSVYRRVAPLLAAVARRPLPADRIRRERALRCEAVITGWPYVNPKEDIEASCMAMAAGLACPEDEIGKRGGSIRRLWRKLKKNRDLAAKLGITLDWSGTNAPAADSTAGKQAEAEPKQQAVSTDGAKEAA